MAPLSTPQSYASFLDLPIELKKDILDLLAHQNDPVDGDALIHRLPPIWIPILVVCKEMHALVSAEAARLKRRYLENNTISFANFIDAKWYISRSHAVASLEYIRRIRIGNFYRDLHYGQLHNDSACFPRQQMTVLHDLPNLKHLILDVESIDEAYVCDMFLGWVDSASRKMLYERLMTDIILHLPVLPTEMMLEVHGRFKTCAASPSYYDNDELVVIPGYYDVRVVLSKVRGASGFGDEMTVVEQHNEI